MSHAQRFVAEMTMSAFHDGESFPMGANTGSVVTILTHATKETFTDMVEARVVDIFHGS